MDGASGSVGGDVLDPKQAHPAALRLQVVLRSLRHNLLNVADVDVADAALVEEAERLVIQLAEHEIRQNQLLVEQRDLWERATEQLRDFRVRLDAISAQIRQTQGRLRRASERG